MSDIAFLHRNEYGAFPEVVVSAPGVVTLLGEPTDYDEGIRYFRGAVRYEHPSYIDRLIAHAYRKKGDIESEYKEWQHCLTIFTDDQYHIDIVEKHLEAAKEKLGK